VMNWTSSDLRMEEDVKNPRLLLAGALVLFAIATNPGLAHSPNQTIRSKHVAANVSDKLRIAQVAAKSCQTTTRPESRVFGVTY